MLTFRTAVSLGFRASSALWNETALKVSFGTTAPRSASSKLLLQLFQLRRESLPDRLAQDDELAGLLSLPTDMGKAQDVEALPRLRGAVG
jgi:hypothetical protein